MISRTPLIGFMLAAAIVLFFSSAWAEIGQIKLLSGDVRIVRNGEKVQAQAGDILQQEDEVETGSDGSVGMTFIDSSRMSLGPDSRIKLQQFQFDPTTNAGKFTTNIKQGTLTVISGKIAKESPESMKVTTPSTILGLRGTVLAVKVHEQQ